MPVAPNITHLAWSQNQPLFGTLKQFAIGGRWNPVVGATTYDVEVVSGGDSIATNVGGAFPTFWWETNNVPVPGNYFRVRAFDGAFSAWTTIPLDPTLVSGPATISAQLNGNVFSGFALGPARPADWAWTLSGAPTGLSITGKDVSSDGGIIVGSPTVEGVFDAMVGVTNYGATSNILNVQNFNVKIHVSGERYLQDFHADTSRTAVNIRHPKGTVASWGANAQNEVELILGDTLTLHTILRDGTGYIAAGVTNLALVAKLPQRPDSPPVLSSKAAAPAVASFGAVKAWPLTVSVESPFARRLFDTANLPPGATPDAVGILLDAQISYTFGGRVYRSLTFKLRLLQAISQL